LHLDELVLKGKGGGLGANGLCELSHPLIKLNANNKLTECAWGSTKVIKYFPFNAKQQTFT